MQIGILGNSQQYADAADINREGITKGTSANVRNGPGVSNFSMIYTLSENQKVTVHESVQGEYVSQYYTDIWYKISYQNSSNVTKQGYVLSTLIMLDPIDPKAYAGDFEAFLSAQGFPESYKPYLRDLHNKYPNWIFEAYHTNLDWNLVINQMHVPGRSLISGANDAWKSVESHIVTIDGRPVERIYIWEENKWIPHDGSTWVCASKDVIAYYMDPRNMLKNERDAFQFERLDWFNAAAHTSAGVSHIIKNTFMSNGYSNYIDDPEGKYDDYDLQYFCNAFIQAGNDNTVSPYHLASRARQEVVHSDGRPSLSARGFFPSDSQYDILRDYEGHYNFYNIGASHSTVLYGNVANALHRAKYGWDSADRNKLYKIPWDDPAKSIHGGAVYIDERYLSLYQYTNYYQKFNVISNVMGRNLFTHLYMANVQAATTESRRMYDAYTISGTLNSPIVFSIPVYLNMPNDPSPLPPQNGNPNNWIKSLTVSGKNVTPTFDPANTGLYTVIVEAAVDNIEIQAVPASDKSIINKSAPGKYTENYSLEIGDNKIDLIVAAENGDLRTYQINVVRKDPGAAPDVTFNSLYLNDDGIITGILTTEINNTVEEIKKLIQVSDTSYTVIVVDNKMNPKTSSDLVATGDQLGLKKDDYIHELDYVFMLYGDVNGDGSIDTRDLNAIFKHIMKRDTITDDLFLKASDANKDGEINTIDLNRIFKHIMKREFLQQNLNSDNN